jgi:hypothetical protein
VSVITGVHPVADLFPMLDGEDLADLAASIAERGQEHPIVLDKEGRILDGRNRFAVCEQLGIEPIVTTYDGDDPDGYALAVNLARRHLTKGQRAMIASGLLRSNNRQTDVAGTAGASQARISQAKVVREYADHLVDPVIAGAVTLNDAYAEARKKKAEKQSATERAADAEAALEELREKAPDLATRVIEEEITLTMAVAEHKEREHWARENAKQANSALATAITVLGRVTEPAGRELAIRQWDPDLCETPPFDVTPDKFRAIGEGLIATADLLEKKQRTGAR